ncbi:MAG: hypothetical protein M1517_01200 [Deltaproteobacteria bacterium]|nr:hypothetical protein [Deltaproteobacteria bacterium]
MLEKYTKRQAIIGISFFIILDLWMLFDLAIKTSKIIKFPINSIFGITLTIALLFLLSLVLLKSKHRSEKRATSAFVLARLLLFYNGHSALHIFSSHIAMLILDGYVLYQTFVFYDGNKKNILVKEKKISLKSNYIFILYLVIVILAFLLAIYWSTFHF